MEKKLKKMVLTALFTSLVCVSTLVVQIPSPMQGYINAGDGILLLSSWLLSPLCGAFAGGVGSCLADLFSGYALYAPGTLVIKGMSALLASCLFHLLKRKTRKTEQKKEESKLSSFLNHLFPLLFSGFCGEAVMVTGYFLYACLFLTEGLAAVSSIPGNLIQALFGIVASILLYPVLYRSGITKEL